MSEAEEAMAAFRALENAAHTAAEAIVAAERELTRKQIKALTQAVKVIATEAAAIKPA